ncbi:MAG: hypothetical protein ACR2GB_01910, partial [Nocardioidaceae bacterium]
TDGLIDYDFATVRFNEIVRSPLCIRALPVAMTSAVLALASACTAGDPISTGGTGPVTAVGAPSLHATFRQERIQEGTRHFNAQLVNNDNRAVTVLSVALRSSVIDPLPPTPKDSVLAPGRIIDFATEYGEPRCDVGFAMDASVVVGLDTGTVELPFDRDGQAWLKRLYIRECAQKRVAEIASLRFSSGVRRDVVEGALVLRGHLVVSRVPDARKSGSADEELTLRSLSGSLLITLAPAPEAPGLPRALHPDQSVLRLPVVLGSTNRCDSHAFEESKQTFLLSAYVKVAGAPTQRVIVIPDMHVQEQTMALLHDVCRGP